MQLRQAPKAGILAVLAVVSALMTAVTLAVPDWIEVVFGVDPDRGSGALEWAIVLSLAVATILLALAARHTWKRARLAAG